MSPKDEIYLHTTTKKIPFAYFHLEFILIFMEPMYLVVPFPH